MENTIQYQLEAMLDKRGMAELLAALVEVCHDKAQHMRENWQDEDMARDWEQCAHAIDEASSKIVNACLLP